MDALQFGTVVCRLHLAIRLGHAGARPMSSSLFEPLLLGYLGLSKWGDDFDFSFWFREIRVLSFGRLFSPCLA